MSHFVIFDNTANLVASYDDLDEARARLHEIAEQDPDAADEYALLEYDDDGHPVGEAVPASEAESIGSERASEIPF